MNPMQEVYNKTTEIYKKTLETAKKTYKKGIQNAYNKNLEKTKNTENGNENEFAYVLRMFQKQIMDFCCGLNNKAIEKEKEYYKQNGFFSNHIFKNSTILSNKIISSLFQTPEHLNQYLNFRIKINNQNATIRVHKNIMNNDLLITTITAFNKSESKKLSIRTIDLLKFNPNKDKPFNIDYVINYHNESNESKKESFSLTQDDNNNLTIRNSDNLSNEKKEEVKHEVLKEPIFKKTLKTLNQLNHAVKAVSSASIINNQDTVKKIDLASYQANNNGKEDEYACSFSQFTQQG